MNENKYYRTSNFELSVFLIAKNFHLLNIENDSDKKTEEEISVKKTFIFDRSPELKNLVRVFYFGKDSEPEILVNARKLLQVRRNLKTQLINLE